MSLHAARWRGALLLAAVLFLGAVRSAPARDESPARDEAATASATPSPIVRPFLFRLEHPELRVPSYIFGTIHLPDKRVTNFPPSMLAAVDACQAIYLEIPITESQGMMMRATMLPDGKTLSDLLPPELYARLVSFLAKKQFDIAAFEHTKIWGVAASLALLDSIKGLSIPIPQDMQIEYMAFSKGKEAGGLETPQEQLSIFESLSLDEQIAMLKASLATLENTENDPLEEMIDAYLSGDGAVLRRVMDEELYEFGEGGEEEKASSERFIAEAITKRDARFAERIDAKLRAAPAKPHFFAIGAAHLLYDTSVLAHLRDRGYSVARLGPEADAIGPAQVPPTDTAPAPEAELGFSQ